MQERPSPSTATGPQNDERLGVCPHCGATNSYLNAVCAACEQPLPWGVVAPGPVVAPVRTAAPATAAPQLPLGKRIVAWIHSAPLWLLALMSLGTILMGLPITIVLATRNSTRAAACGICSVLSLVLGYYCGQFFGLQ